MSDPEPTGQMIEAVVIDPQLVRQQAQQIRSQREEAAKKSKSDWINSVVKANS